jgi:multiple sugar transport system permease protein
MIALTETSKKSKKLNFKDNKIGWLFALPAVILLLFFTVLPIALSLTLGFTNAQLLETSNLKFVGTQNFKSLLGMSEFTLHASTNADGSIAKDEHGKPVFPQVRSLTRPDSPYLHLRGMQEIYRFGQNDKAGTVRVILARDPTFWRSMTNTLFFALVVVPLQGGLGLLLALLVHQKLKGRNIFRTIYFIPTLTSMVVVSLLWQFLLQQNGMINKAIHLVIPGYINIDWLGNTHTAMYAIIGLSIWQAVGYHMIIWLGGLQTIPEELYEAARTDGANKWHEFRYVTWPGLRHTLVFVLITITIAALGLFTQINVLTQGGPLNSTSTLVYQTFSRGYQEQQIGAASSISFIFFILVLIISLLQRILTRKADQ